MTDDWMTRALAEVDPELARVEAGELNRQRARVELIASENYASRAVLEAQGGVMTNKYAEGYPGKRYYGGCEWVDKAEELARARLRGLFGGVAWANVQPHSGSQANQAVLLALAKPGDVILGMRLDAGGHLTHGSRVNLTGKWFDVAAYGVRRDDERIDYDEMARLARETKPKIIIVGFSAYARVPDFARARAIADDVGAWLLADVAHPAGLIVAGEHPSPFPHAHVATMTTHKTLRGARGAAIVCDDEELGARLDKAVFPGLQGGPLLHAIAGKAVAFHEAAQPAFREYARAAKRGARALAAALTDAQIRVVSGGTDNHMVLVDLRSIGVSGSEGEARLEAVGITVNRNGVPFDEMPPSRPSGVRLGSAACAARGFDEADFAEIGDVIVRALKGDAPAPLAARVREVLARRPLYPGR